MSLAREQARVVWFPVPSDEDVAGTLCVNSQLKIQFDYGRPLFMGITHPDDGILMVLNEMKRWYKIGIGAETRKNTRNEHPIGFVFL